MPTYPKECPCGNEFEAKSARAIYCPDCREDRQQTFFDKQNKKKYGVCVCLDCGETKPRIWKDAKYCLDCYISYKEAKEDIEERLKPGYIARFIDGELVIALKVISAANHKELRKMIRDGGLGEILLMPRKREE